MSRKPDQVRAANRAEETAEPTKRKIRPFTAILVVAILFVIAFGVRFSLTPTDDSESAVSPITGGTPQPWEYDPASDRHWVADHGHWHDGPPPGNLSGQPMEVQPTLPQPLSRNRQPMSAQPDMSAWGATEWSGSQPESAPAPGMHPGASPEMTAEQGPPPQPWQYDPDTNRFWHPEHGHWHDGPPPLPGMR